jgi:hypothetical protein
MFEIVENAPNRLILRLGRWPFQTSTVIFDKASSKARFERTVVSWKRRPIEVPIEEIAAITVGSQQASDPKDKRTRGAGPVVQLKSGQSIRLSDAGSAKNTIEAVRQMCAFLGLAEAETSAAPQPDETSVAPPADQPNVAPAAGSPTAPPPIPTPTAEPPIVKPRASRALRWAIRAASVLAALFLLVMGGSWAMTNWFTLPDCDDEKARSAIADYYGRKRIRLDRLSEIKMISATTTERMCAGRADFPSGMSTLEYRADWNGWSSRFAVVREQAEVKIDRARLEDVRKAADDFLAFARNSHVTGRPPRLSDPAIRELFDKVFDLSDLDGTPLVATDVTKAIDWYFAGDRVGFVYILAGTGFDDMNKLPNDPNIQRRTHRNIAEYAAEVARYFDFQIKLAAIMMEAELSRTAKASADAPQRPEVRREITEVRNTLFDVFTGTLTALAYEGVSDDWRRQRLKPLMEAAPKASEFLLPDQARAVREHALRVVTFLRDRGLQDNVRAFADRVSGR